MDAAKEHIQAEVNDIIDRIQNWYRQYPDWASLRVRPITREGVESTRYYLGEGGYLYDLRTHRRVIDYNYDSPEAVDWRATDTHIRRMYSDGESNSLDELAAMRWADQDLLSLMDEEAQLMALTQPEVAEVIEATAFELRQLQLENDLAESQSIPLPEVSRVH